MVDINTALLAKGGPIWRSDGLSVASRTSENSNTLATKIPIAAGVKMVRLSPVENQDYTVWITDQSVVVADIVKANGFDGGIKVNGSIQEGYDIWFDDADPPLVFFAENGAANLTIQVIFHR